MALWGGRFASGPADSVAALSRSVDFDWRLVHYDIRVNVAHVHGLERSGVINSQDGEKIVSALAELSREIAGGLFSYNGEDEDVHSAVERGLTAKLGNLGGAVRAGRSRNDLVVTDFKLYLIDHILEIGSLVGELVSAFNDLAEKYSEAVAPGFTHLQHAQPISFGHELAKHSHALLRDNDRIADWLTRNDFSPLGAGALAGSSLQPDPEITARELGFSDVHRNSIDAVSDRDFVAEALFILSVIGVHLSRIGEEFTLWSSTEFGWAKIDDAYSTGSSIMPQKKNPDIAELARGKSGRLIGNLTGLLVTLKGLPFAYNRDLQEDKEPVFDSVETLLILLPALIGMVATTTFNTEKMEASAAAGHSLATEVADFLARAGVPFAHAHEIAGKCVRLAEEKGIEVHELSNDELQATDPLLTEKMRAVLSAHGAIASRSAVGATSIASVARQISNLRVEHERSQALLATRRSAFTEMMAI